MIIQNPSALVCIVLRRSWLSFLYRQRSGNPIISYKQERWNPGDKMAVVIFSLALTTTLALLFMENGPSFSYSPYPVIAFPRLHWTGIVLSLIPGLPMLIQKND